MTKRAIVAGGGIAGTVAAIALHRAGWQPVIHEAYPRDADQRGAFLTVAVNGLTALRALDLDPEALLSAGYPTPKLYLNSGSGRRLAELPLGDITTTVRRADLYESLRAEAERRGIEIAYGQRLTDFHQTAEGVTAVFEDGEESRGAVLIGADGLRSRTRQVLDPSGPQPEYLGLLNAGGFTDRPVEADLDRTPGVVHMIFGRRAFFGWSLAPDGTVWWFANPPSKQPVGPMAPSLWRDELIELFEADASPAAAIIRATDEALGPWNTYDLARVPVWHRGRVVLLGDAAHAVAPSSGQGASMAIEDAVVLGRVLSGHDVPAELAEYERRRRDRVQKVVAFGRRNSSGKTAGPIGAWIRDAMTPALMRLLHRKGDPAAWILDHRV